MKKIYRSRSQRVLAGVCGGFAEYFAVDVILVRLIWIFLTIFGGSGIIAYVLSLVLIPDESERENTLFYKKLTCDSDHSRLWGVVLIVIGMVLIFQYNELFGSLLSRFWGFGFNLLVTLVLIGLGLYLLTNHRTNLARSIGLRSKMPLHLSRDERVIAGVCGGVAESLDLDATLVRFIWTFGTFMSAGAGIVLYLILALLLPKLKSFQQDNPV
ncbi:MAG: PspC domain-containing protein [Candidatus Neomarinimicrobiota bacterium]